MLLMGKSNISMAIFNSYVSLPEDHYHILDGQGKRSNRSHRFFSTVCHGEMVKPWGFHNPADGGNKDSHSFCITMHVIIGVCLRIGSLKFDALSMFSIFWRDHSDPFFGGTSTPPHLQFSVEKIQNSNPGQVDMYSRTSRNRISDDSQ